MIDSSDFRVEGTTQSISASEDLRKRTVYSSALAPDAETIVIVSDNAYINGGNAQVGITSAIGLADSGVNVVLFAAGGPADVGLLNKKNLRVYCLGQSDAKSNKNVLFGAVQGIWNEKASREFKLLLAELDAKRTVVHLHSWTKSLSSSVVRAARETGFKIVVTLHDYFAVCPNGSYYIHPKERPCTLRPMSVPCIQTNCDPRNYAQKLYRVGRQTVAGALGGMPTAIQHYISISKHSTATIQPFLPADASIYDVPNPIAGVKSPPARVSENSQFIFIGRLSKEKGPQLFLDAAHSCDVKAVIVGDGPDRERLQTQYPQAIFTGWLPHAEARIRLYSARALVMPSMWEEPFGLVALEALSVGVPPIVPVESGARQHVVDGYNGLLFKRGNVADLAAKMTALQHGGLAGLLGRAAYERYWRNPFTIERHVSSLLHVYRQVLAT